jgi:hypothetical protein
MTLNPLDGYDIRKIHETATLNIVRPEHTLTGYACRVLSASGRQAAVVLAEGDWTLVWQVARP